MFLFFLIQHEYPLYANLGVKQSYTEAAKYFTFAAKQNDALSQYNLGILYLNGQGVKQSDTEAKKFFGKSCYNGVEKGCHNYKNLNLNNK